MGHSHMQHEGTYPLLGYRCGTNRGGGKEQESGRLRKCQSPVCVVLCDSLTPGCHKHDLVPFSLSM